MALEKSDIPFSSQFTPAQVSLPEVLKMLPQLSGDRKAMDTAFGEKFFPHIAGVKKGDVAKNLPLSLRAYGILGEDWSITAFGKSLVQVADDEKRLYADFGTHILLKLRGLEVVGVVSAMKRARLDVNLTTVREELEKHSIHMPRGGTHFSGMAGWLQKAGVLDAKWNVNELRLRVLAGVTPQEASTLADFSKPLRMYLRTLASLRPKEPMPSNKVARMAEKLYGVAYPDKSLPKLLQPLVKEGYITLEKAAGQGGRGGKPHLVGITEKTLQTVSESLMQALSSATGLTLIPFYDRPLDDILADLKSDNTHTKGVALEALAIYLCRLLDLSFRAWRLRSKVTGGAEVDVMVEGARLIFSRWQIQCKNTKRVRVDDVAKEVGLSLNMKSNVVMVVSTGKIGAEARKYADTIMRDTLLQVILLDEQDLHEVSQDPTLLAAVLERQAEHAMDVKRIEVSEEIEQ